jgi:hypothetical protein
MEKILEDIREMVDNGNADDILEFAEILMIQNRELMEQNQHLIQQTENLISNFEPEPEPQPEPEPEGELPIFQDEIDYKYKEMSKDYIKHQYKGTEKLEYQEGIISP